MTGGLWVCSRCHSVNQADTDLCTHCFSPSVPPAEAQTGTRRIRRVVPLEEPEPPRQAQNATAEPDSTGIAYAGAPQHQDSAPRASRQDLVTTAVTLVGVGVTGVILVLVLMDPNARQGSVAAATGSPASSTIPGGSQRPSSAPSTQSPTSAATTRPVPTPTVEPGNAIGESITVDGYLTYTVLGVVDVPRLPGAYPRDDERIIAVDVEIRALSQDLVPYDPLRFHLVEGRRHEVLVGGLPPKLGSGWARKGSTVRGYLTFVVPKVGSYSLVFTPLLGVGGPVGEPIRVRITEVEPPGTTFPPTTTPSPAKSRKP